MSAFHNSNDCNTDCGNCAEATNIVVQDLRTKLKESEADFANWKEATTIYEQDLKRILELMARAEKAEADIKALTQELSEHTNECNVSHNDSKGKIEGLEAEVERLKEDLSDKVEESLKHLNLCRKAEAEAKRLLARGDYYKGEMEKSRAEVEHQKKFQEHWKRMSELPIPICKRCEKAEAEVERKVWEGVETALEMLGFPEGSVEYAQVKKEWKKRQEEGV